MDLAGCACLGVLISAVLVGLDAAALRTHRTQPGRLTDMGPLGWMLCCVVLPFVGLTAYACSRARFVRATGCGVARTTARDRWSAKIGSGYVVLAVGGYAAVVAFELARTAADAGVGAAGAGEVVLAWAVTIIAITLLHSATSRGERDGRVPRGQVDGVVVAVTGIDLTVGEAVVVDFYTDWRVTIFRSGAPRRIGHEIMTAVRAEALDAAMTRIHVESRIGVFDIETSDCDPQCVREVLAGLQEILRRRAASAPAAAEVTLFAPTEVTRAPSTLAGRMELLKRLTQQRIAGQLSDAEFDARRRRVLGVA